MLTEMALHTTFSELSKNVLPDEPEPACLWTVGGGHPFRQVENMQHCFLQLVCLCLQCVPHCHPLQCILLH